MERRKHTVSKATPLPSDYTKMVFDVFTSHFEEGLKAFEKLKPNTQFEVHGEIYGDEVLLGVSLVTEGQLAASTVLASSDFDPKASAPGIQDLLSACVDAIAAVYGTLLVADKPERLAQLADDSLSALEDVPFEWTSVESNKRQIFVRIDKSNPKMDAMADDWLSKHDPEAKEKESKDQKATEALFFTGPKKKSE